MIEFSQCAIIVQGKYLENYTADVLLNYLNNTPYIIILSTWKDSNIELEINRIKEKYSQRFHFIFSTPPEYSGYQNINLQIISSLKGINIAENLGIKYTAKVRTDFYFECDIFQEYFNRVINKNKVLAIETVNPINCLYFVADFIFVGPINELKSIFHCPLVQSIDNRLVDCEFNRRMHDSDYFRLINNSNAERYLLINYMLNSGYIIPHNLLEMAYLWPNFLVEKFYLVKSTDLKISSLNKYNSLSYDSYVFPFFVKYQNKGKIYKKIILITIFINLLFNWIKNHIGNVVYFFLK